MKNISEISTCYGKHIRNIYVLWKIDQNYLCFRVKNISELSPYYVKKHKKTYWSDAVSMCSTGQMQFLSVRPFSCCTYLFYWFDYLLYCYMLLTGFTNCMGWLSCNYTNKVKKKTNTKCTCVELLFMFWHVYMYFTCIHDLQGSFKDWYRIRILTWNYGINYMDQYIAK